MRQPRGFDALDTMLAVLSANASQTWILGQPYCRNGYPQGRDTQVPITAAISFKSEVSMDIEKVRGLSCLPTRG